MKFDQNLEPVRVALASYDVRELRVQKRYLEDQDVPLACDCYQRGWALLGELRRHSSYDVVVLSSQLEDMDEEMKSYFKRNRKGTHAWENVKEIATNTNPLLNNLAGLFKRK